MFTRLVSLERRCIPTSRRISEKRPSRHSETETCRSSWRQTWRVEVSIFRMSVSHSIPPLLVAPMGGEDLIELLLIAP